MKQKIVDGKKVIKTSDNIKIVPLKEPKDSLFRDEKEIYVFPHAVSIEERNRVFIIMTDSKIEKIARAISGIFKFPEGLNESIISQSYADSLPLPFIPEYTFIRHKDYKQNGARQ
jgi:hypothetical protein